MDIEDLSASLQVLHHNGTKFNVEERFQIEVALQNLLNNSGQTDFDELLFWGRISAVKGGDYFIALGICYKDRYEFPEKKFFWCSQANDMVFQQFPALNEHHKEELEKRASQPFSGADPMEVLVKVDEPVKSDAPVEEAKAQDSLADTEDIDPESLVVKLDFKEVDRLHYHVRAIENDCHIIPQGSMKLTPLHEVARNEAFRGLSVEECYKLNFYSHFRNVQDNSKKENLEADDAIFMRDFLDEVITDKPEGCWSLQKDGTESFAIIRNNVWKGYCAYHFAGTQMHGSVYVGDGLKQENFCFMK